MSVKQPVISFVVPIYAVERYLERCVDSILAQDIDNMEIILVDDGSPDNCGEIADRYALQDNRVKVIHKKNAGLGMARNSGMAMATGEYICFVDSDDWLEPEGVKTLIKAAEKHDADIVISGFYDWDLVNLREAYVPTPMPEGVYSHDEIIEGFWLPMIGSSEMDCPSPTKKHWCTAWRGIYRRRFIDANDLRFPSEKEQLIEDLPFNVVAYYRAKSIYMSDCAYYHYRFNEKSLVNTYRENTIERYIKMRSFLLSFARESGLEAHVIDRLKGRDYVLLAHSISGIMSPRLEVKLTHRLKLVRELIDTDQLCYVFRGLKISGLKAPRLAKVFFLLIKYKMPSVLIMVFLLKRFSAGTSHLLPARASN